MWPPPSEPAKTPTTRNSSATGSPSRAETRLSATLAARSPPNAVSITAVAIGSAAITSLALDVVARAALPRQPLALARAPVGDLPVIAREQDVRDGVPPVLRRPRVARRRQPALPERIGVRAVMVAHRARQ